MIKKIKLKYIFVIFLILITFFIFKMVGSYPDNYYLKKIKNIVPTNLKVFVKENITVHKTYQLLKKNYDIQTKNLNNALIDADDLPNQMGFIPAEYATTTNLTLFEKNFSLEKFKLSYLTTAKHRGTKGNSYLDFHKNKLFIATANGIFSYVDISEFNKKMFRLNVIKSNLKKIIKHEKFYQKSSFGIKDMLIFKDNIYISYTKQLEKNCFNTSILSAKLNLNELNFEDFYTPDICVNVNNEYGEFNAHHAGGRIVVYKDNKLLFSTGEFRFRDHAQDETNVLGKIISIDISDKKAKILSVGHRNPQGLFYDSVNNLIISTEHGPKGGDEININLIDNKIKNFGWPISSYGEHYPGVTKIHTNNKNLKKFLKTAPLHKSHKKYGYEEPLKYFVPSIGISEILKLNKKFTDSNAYIILSSSLNGRSLYYASLDSNYKIIEDKLLFIGNEDILGERVRDFIYIEELNKIVLFFEESPSIGILSPNL